MRNIYRLFEVRKFYCSIFFDIRTTVWEKILSFNKTEPVFFKICLYFSGNLPDQMSLLKPPSSLKPDETIIS
jgi:hypothetical protein